MSSDTNTDLSPVLQQQIQSAFEQGTALQIVAGNSKAFYGRPVATTGSTAVEILDVSAHTGILNYEPTELVITARAGTRLADIEQLLADNGQMLAFEPPTFATDTATIGGTIACNFSGPRRAYAGSARDFLLGCKIINGKGEILHFGGEVMKNVAGYDVARLMAGAMGTLGVLLEVSLKVLPIPETEITLRLDYDMAAAIQKMRSLARTPLPVSASSYHDSQLHLRLSGTNGAVNAACQSIGDETLKDADHYWSQLKNQQVDFFTTELPLWRLSLAADIETLTVNTEAETLLCEWGGTLRWLKADIDSDKLQQAMKEVDGHAILFRDLEQDKNTERNRFQTLNPGMLSIHKNLKQAFDPKNILNPGKLYPQL